MKGFKHTGNGPVYGDFKFDRQSVSVKPHRRGMPIKMATGGVVKDSSLVRRDKPVTGFDKEAGGKSPMRPGYKKGGWIKKAIKNPGALHKSLGVPQDEKIPVKKLDKAAHSDNPTTRRRAQLAKTLEGFNKCEGGMAGYAEGGRVCENAVKRGIAAHEAKPRPRGHGM